MNQTVGEIIEKLIYIKDNYGIEDRGDLEAINNACNILSHNFDRLTTANILINGQVVNIIKTALVENGFESNEKNVSLVFTYPKFAKHFEENGIEYSWPVIHNAILELKDKLQLKEC